jgi:hypothetical protein
MSDALEMAHCVEINLENMVTIMPTLKIHPLLPIVKLQIRECIEALEAAELPLQPTEAGGYASNLRCRNDILCPFHNRWHPPSPRHGTPESDDDWD